MAEHERTRTVVARHVTLLDLLLRGEWVSRRQLAHPDGYYPNLLDRHTGDRRTLSHDLQRWRELHYRIDQRPPDKRAIRDSDAATARYIAYEREDLLTIPYSESEQAALAVVRTIVAVVDRLDDHTLATIAALELPAEVHVLARALQDRQVVEFSFRGERRQLHPYALAIGDLGRWFVGGWSGDDVRTFPVDELDNVSIVPQVAFSSPEDGDIDRAQSTDSLRWQVDDEPTHATLQFSATATAETREAFDDAATTDPAATTVQIVTLHRRELFRRLSAHWPEVTLAGPADLCGEFVAHLDRLAGA